MTRSKALLLLLAVCLSSMNACSLNGFQKALQKESESVDADENKQKAEAPLADTRQLDSPQRDQISMGTRYTKGDELVSLEFAPKYTMSEEERKIIQVQIDDIVDVWLGGISINDTDYDKAKYVYELLALKTEYVQDATDSQNIISVFIKRHSVCQGYA